MYVCLIKVALETLIPFQASTSVYIDGKTVVPVLNVLCVEASQQELNPLIYKNWSHPDPSATVTNMSKPANWYNSTVFDPIFGFDFASPPPVFLRIPGANNSILNGNWNVTNAMFLLLSSGLGKEITYNLCGMSMGIRGGCSSEFSVSMRGSMLKSNCAQHDMSYDQPVNIAQNLTAISWAHMAYTWANAIVSGNPLEQFLPPRPVCLFYSQLLTSIHARCLRQPQVWK